MKKTEKKLMKIDVVSAGVNLAGVYAVLGVISAICFIFIFGGEIVSSLSPLLIWTAIVLAGMVSFAVLGLVKGMLVALIYNFVAKYTGGIAFEVSG